MAEWRISLSGRDQELDLLMLSNAGDPDWSMAKDASGYYLAPKRVFQEGQVGDIHKAAESWVKSTNLAGSLFDLPNFQEISFTVEYVKGDGTKSQFLFARAAGDSDAFATATVIGSDGKPVQAQIHPIASARAMARANVAEAVRLFLDKREDWTQLCNVIQMVRNDLGTEIPPEWVSRTKLKRLERTAQFRETAGNTARHAKPNGRPPPKPMPVLDAQEIVRQILIYWVRNTP